MSELTVLNDKFESTGTLSTNVSLGADDINTSVVHQVVKATLAGKRQGTASTKSRCDVRGGGAKPFKQKGTGRARQGSTRSGLMVGGATIHGPKPRSYEQKVNKKVGKKAVQAILADKLQAGKLTVVESFNSTGKTKDLFKALSERNLLPGLVVTAKKDDLALRAAKNLQWGKGVPVDGFSVYEAVKYENLIIEKEALESLLGKLG